MQKKKKKKKKEKHQDGNSCIKNCQLGRQIVGLWRVAVKQNKQKNKKTKKKNNNNKKNPAVKPSRYVYGLH